MLAAYEALLKARHFHWKMTGESLDQAKAFYEKAIALDPGFAQAHAECAEFLMGEAYIARSSLPDMALAGRALAQKALALDASLEDAHGLAVYHRCEP